MLLKDFVQHAYLDYAMYVILDRALPSIADGLKPVQRRIVYAMGELGLAHHAKFKKSARTVGDVLGKFHPHGETACYEAMVHMAQSFSYRYPLIDGQGNWGAPDDPKSFAAMRYTEARLTAYAHHLLLSELKQNTVNWKPNFDGTLDEPYLLPARLPNILLNGASGIAVGMATDIPPHNLAEVVDACNHLLEHPETDITTLCNYIQGPDFPTGGEIITPAAELLDIYTQGKGAIKLRATFEVVDHEIIIETLPYQVSSNKILEQIAQQMQAKNLPMVVDLRDESDHENAVRLVIVLRSHRVEADKVMQHLFAVTDLEKTQKVNFNMIGLDHKPQVKNIKQLLNEWLNFRKQTLVKRLENRLEQVNHRLVILAGLLIVYLHIDEVIKIIRSEDNPKGVLQERFALSEIQVEAILEIRLRQLAKLEGIRLEQEQEALLQEQTELQNVLSNDEALKKLLQKELAEDKARFADQRLTKLVNRKSAKAFTRHELLGAEPVTIVLSEQGWVRSVKGHPSDFASFSYKTGDKLLQAMQARSDQPLVFFTQDGRSYSVAAADLPVTRSYGEPLSSRFKTASGIQFISAAVVDDHYKFLLASSDAYGFIADAENLLSKNKSGKTIMHLSQEARLLPVPLLNLQRNTLADLYLALATNRGYLLIFSLDNLPQLAQGKGNKLINLTKTKAELLDKQPAEALIALCVFAKSDQLVVHAGKRQLTLKPGDWKNYLGKRAQRGKLLPRGFGGVHSLSYIDD